MKDPNGDLSPSPTPDEGNVTTGYMLTLIRTDKATHIYILATASAVLLGFLALLGSHRRRSRSKVFLFVLEAAYNVSYVLVSYTIGLIQSFDSPNPAGNQVLWAAVLLLLLGSADTISAFSRHDVEQRKGMQMKHILQTLLVFWLLLSRAISLRRWWIFQPALVLCCAYSIFKMAQRTKALRMACMAEYGLVRGAKVVADYMVRLCADGDDNAADNPSDMTRYKYLVLGEDKHSTPPSKPPYLTEVAVGDNDSKVVTIDMIWKHDGELLSSDDKHALALKDMCLSFALFKLLKRRFCGLEIAEAGKDKTRDFVLHVLLGLNNNDDHVDDDDQRRRPVAERAFHVVEVELSFLYDLFYTKYPALFPVGALVHCCFLPFFFLLFMSATEDVVLSNAYRQYYGPYITIASSNDLVLVAIIFAIDVMQQVATVYSNWAVVHFVCDYVRPVSCLPVHTLPPPISRWWTWIRQKLIKLASRRHQKARHWDHKLGQYSLLKSMEYNPRFTNALSKLTLRLMDREGIGRKREPDVRLPAEVMEAVADALRRFLEEGNGCLTNGVKSIKDGEEEAWGLRWSCKLPTTTHTVLVWHIATTLCDVQDAFTTDDGDEVALAKLHRHRLVATCLSGYCAYLLAFVPEMLPDHSYTGKQILDAVVQEARQNLVNTEHRSKIKQILDAIASKGREYLGITNTNHMSEMCAKMTELGAPAGAGEGRDEETPILNLGARLRSRLAEIAKPRRWELLAEFWAELVLFLAPSDNTDVHAEHLAKGGEFMTHIWVLLMHAGILKRRDYFT